MNIGTAIVISAIWIACAVATAITGIGLIMASAVIGTIFILMATS